MVLPGVDFRKSRDYCIILLSSNFSAVPKVRQISKLHEDDYHSSIEHKLHLSFQCHLDTMVFQKSSTHYWRGS